MGSPGALTVAQLKLLQTLTAGKAEVHMLSVDAHGSAMLSIPMRSNDIVLVEITRRE